MKKNKILFILASAALLASCGAGAQNSASTPASQGASEPTSASVELKIELSIDKATIKVGETAKLTSSVEGVTFEARDASIVSVDATGVVTGLKAGSTRITARKTGYKIGSVDITVEKAASRAADFYLEFEDAEHYDPDGFWGMEFFGQVYGPGDSPVEQAEAAHGGQSVGWFTQGCKETIYFTSDKAGKVELDFMMAYNAEMALQGVMEIRVNGTLLDLTGKVVAGPEEEGDYYDFNPINFKDVDVIAGENKIEVTALAQGPNLDCVQVYTKELQIVQRKIEHVVKQTIEGTFTAARVELGGTYQIPVTTEGVSFASSDATIATVSATGLVSGVAVGQASITITKDGYRDVTVAITVYEPIVDEDGVQYLEFELAEHYAPDGVWGFPQWGMSYDTPVESSDTGHGGQHVGWFAAGCKETIRFTSDKAATADLDFMFARNAEMPLEGVLSIKVNGVELPMTGKTVLGPSDGDSNNYNDFNPVSWTGVALLEGENVIVVEALAQGPNMDCIKVKNTDAKIVQAGAAVLENIEGTFDDVALEVGQTEQLSVTTAGVAYASSNEAVATVSATGLITAIAAGTADITISKEGFRDAKVKVTVTTPVSADAKTAYLEFEEAEHYSPTGLWNNKDNPLEANEGSHGGYHIGYFAAGCKETLRFTASKAGKADLAIVAANNTDMALEGVLSITLNGASLDLSGLTIVGGGQWNYTTFRELEISDVDLLAGDNVIVVEALQQGPNLDCIKVSTEGIDVAQTIMPSIEGSFDNVSMKVGETKQISVTTEGVSFESSAPTVVSVSDSGLLTALSAGSATIKVTKDGMKPASFAVTCFNKAVAAEGEAVLELEDATHYSPDGTWGGSWATLTTPVEENALASGGKSVGNFKTGCTETLTFTASSAGKAKITLVGASVLAAGQWWSPSGMSAMTLSDYMGIAVNGTSIDLAGKSLPGKDGGAADYYNWAEVDLGEVDVVAGTNTIVITITGSQGPNMDYVRVAGVGGVTIS